MNQLQDKLRLLRQRHRYTQKEVAEKLDIHVTTYGKIELGEIGIDVYKAQKLAKLYQIRIDDLFTEEAENVNQVNESSANLLYGKPQGSPIRLYLEIQPDANQEQLQTLIKGLQGIVEDLKKL